MHELSHDKSGKAGRLSIHIPKGVALPGRLREVRLDYGCVEIVCEISAAPCSGGAMLGIDLGVNTLIAATDGKKAILTGRAADTSEIARAKSREAAGL